MGILAGKRALIVGVATDRSIAWGIAQCMHAQGATLAFSFANDKFRERVEPLAASLGSTLLMPLDVQSDQQIDAAGQRFDPAKHEAVLMQPTADAAPNSVLTVVQPGYELNGRLLRPARVVVATALAGK